MLDPVKDIFKKHGGAIGLAKMNMTTVSFYIFVFYSSVVILILYILYVLRYALCIVKWLTLSFIS